MKKSHLFLCTLVLGLFMVQNAYAGWFGWGSDSAQCERCFAPHSYYWDYWYGYYDGECGCDKNHCERCFAPHSYYWDYWYTNYDRKCGCDTNRCDRCFAPHSYYWDYWYTNYDGPCKTCNSCCG